MSEDFFAADEPYECLNSTPDLGSLGFHDINLAQEKISQLILDLLHSYHELWEDRERLLREQKRTTKIIKETAKLVRAGFDDINNIINSLKRIDKIRSGECSCGGPQPEHIKVVTSQETNLTRETSVLQSKMNMLSELLSSEREHKSRIMEEFLELRGNVRVYVRVQSHNSLPIGTPSPLSTTPVTSAFAIHSDQRSISFRSKTYMFDRVFTTSKSMAEIFKPVIEEFTTSALAGNPMNVFAYGPSGSGKTYTLLTGPEAIVTQVMQQLLFFRKHREQESMGMSSCAIEVRYVLIRNNEIYDLFSSQLEQRAIYSDEKDPSSDAIPTLSPTGITDLAQFESLLKSTLTRHAAMTAKKPSASILRGHSVLTIWLRESINTSEETQRPASSSLLTSSPGGKSRIPVRTLTPTLPSSDHGPDKAETTINFVELAFPEVSKSRDKAEKHETENFETLQSLKDLLFSLKRDTGSAGARGKAVDSSKDSDIALAKDVKFMIGKSKLLHLLRHSLIPKSRMLLLTTVNTSSSDMDSTASALAWAAEIAKSRP